MEASRRGPQGRGELESSEVMKERGSGQRGVLVRERGRGRGNLNRELGSKKMRSPRPAWRGHGG